MYLVNGMVNLHYLNYCEKFWGLVNHRNFNVYKSAVPKMLSSSKWLSNFLRAELMQTYGEGASLIDCTAALLVDKVKSLASPVRIGKKNSPETLESHCKS